MSESATIGSEQRYLRLLVGLIVIIFLVRAPLTASFWLDETITAWIVSGPLSSVWSRSIDFQGQSPFYYVLVWGIRQMFGAEEVVLRALSLVCGVLTIAVVARIARKLGNDSAVPFVTAALLVGSDGFQDAVLSARPYALGILLAAWSFGVLLSLREGYSKPKAALFTALVVATFYTHYLFSVVAFVHLFVLVKDRRLMVKLVPWGILAVALAVPGVFQLLSLSKRAATLSFAELPTVSMVPLSGLPAACLRWALTVVGATLPLITVVSCLMGLLLSVIWDGKLRVGETARRSLELLSPYIFVPPIFFLFVTYLSPGMLFVPRYWSWALVPLSMALAVVLCSIQGTRSRKIALATTVVFVMLRVLSQERVVEEWRGAAERVRGTGERIVLFSGLIEAESATQPQSGDYFEYLRAPLRVYGVGQSIEVVGVTRTEDELRETFQNSPFTLVAARVRRAREQSPERFLRIIESQGKVASVEPLGRLISIVVAH